MKFKEFEKLMEKLNNTPISEFDKNTIEKLGVEVKENSENIEIYKDLVKFTQSVETLLWVSKKIQSKIATGRVGL